MRWIEQLLIRLEQPMLTTSIYPNDFDTTALALTIVDTPNHIADSIMDQVLNNLGSDGLVQVYDDPQRPRFDAVVCVNVLTFFYSYGRGHQLQRTYDWILKVLYYRAYLEGSLYYSTPEWFLFAISRLIFYVVEANQSLPTDFLQLFQLRCRERIGASGDSLARAMRIISCVRAGIHEDELQRDLRDLKSTQCSDGGWPYCPMYVLPKANTQIGNRGVSTALALQAIQLAELRSL